MLSLNIAHDNTLKKLEEKQSSLLKIAIVPPLFQVIISSCQLPAVKTKHMLFSWLVFFSRFRQKTRENPSCWNPHHLNWRLRINKINKNPQKHAILFLKGPSTSEVTFYNRLIGLFKWFAPFQWLRFHFTLCKCRLYYKERWESSVAQLFLVKNERVNKIYRI